MSASAPYRSAGPDRAHRLAAAALWLALALGPSPAAAEGGALTLSFKDAEIGAVIETVAELTGKRFVVDPRVKGRVTLVSGAPLPADALYQAFLAVLAVHGYAAVPSGEVVKIVPVAGTRTLGAAPRAGEQLVTRVLAVREVAATQLVPILRPLVAQQGHLAAHAGANVLIVADRAANVERIARIVARIDRAAGKEVEAIALEHASATEVARIARELVGGEGKGPARVRVAADARTNSLLVRGDEAARLRVRAIAALLDAPRSGGGDTRVVYLRYARAGALAKLLQGIVAGEAKAAKGSGGIKVQADESTNALVITAPPAVFRTLEPVIRQLDIPRAQVLVEAVIAEVSLDRTRELGIQWAVDTTPKGDGPTGGTNFDLTGNGIVQLAAQAQSGTPALGAGLSLAVGRIDSDRVNFGVLLRALAADADANILSTPTLVTLDNEEAEIVVGQNVPFVTGEFSTVGAGGTTPVNPFRTIERRDVGLKLKVRPQINEGDAIQLEISQEVSSIRFGSAGAADLITNKRAIRTRVLVRDGQLVVLGGLIDDSLTQAEQKVPLLGDLPVLGGLFRYRQGRKVKRNLLVFLRPVILRDPARLDAISAGKYDYLRAEQLRMGGERRALFPRDEAPALAPREGRAPAPPAPRPASPPAAPARAQDDDEEDWP
ncbi:MAG TPA: type II secretion system protein GspD [Chromatiales bacterium]|nr:type II secretion system protein GspD [Chromatiales bacterium]